MEDSLKASIEQSRRMSPDNKMVTYDLTTGIDFSNPSRTAEALADVFFEMDASKWFVEANNGELSFVPKYKARILILEEHNKKVDATVKDFKRDLDKDDLRREYSRQIENAATYKAGIGMYFFAGILTTLLIESHARKVQKRGYVVGLLRQILDNTEITSTSST